MANPFPSDWSLTPPTTPAAKTKRFSIRNLSIKNVLSLCGQIFSTTSETTTPLSSPGQPSPQSQTEADSKTTSWATADECRAPLPNLPSPRWQRQRSSSELKDLQDSHLGLQLAILLPEEIPAPPLETAQDGSTRPQITPHAEEGQMDAIPLLDLDAADDGGSQLSDRPQGTPNTAMPDEDMRLCRQKRRVSGSELAEHAGRCICPSDLLFR